MQPLFDAITEALFSAALITALPLSAAVVVGTLVAMLQAATQIQEQTLTFVPKLVAVCATIFVCLDWIGELLETLLRQALLGPVGG